MPARQRDVKIRILSEYYDAGSKAAERATRRLATLQMAAASEEARRAADTAAKVAAANAAQAGAMRTSGRIMLGVTAAVAVGLGLTAKAATDWQSAFAGVRKVIDGTPEQVASLERELRGLAQTLPATHEEIAGVAEVAGQLGVARGDIAAFTKTAINMGETTNMAADEAATAMAQLGNIMGTGATQADRMGSAIVALGNDGASTEQDIVSMALRIAGAGRSVGMTTDQVLAISSALASVGLEVEAGGTAISRVILAIDKDVRAGADTLSTYAQVSGVSVDEFTKAWTTDAAGALTMFVNGLGQVQASGGNTTKVLDTLGFTEVRVTDALRRAAYAGGLLNDALETSKTAWRENNALTAEAARRYETAESRLEVAKNRINDVAIDIGANFLPAIASGAQTVADLAEGFRALPEPVQEWTVKLGTAAVGLLGIVGGAAVVIPKLAELKVTMDALAGGSSLFGKALGGATSILAGPWGLAIAGAVVAGGLWMANQGEVRRNVQALTDTLDEQTGAITDNTREKTVARLQERGVLEAAATLGLELDKVTDAALLNGDAMAYVADAVERTYAANDEAARTEQLSDAMLEQADAAAVLERGLLGQRNETTTSQEAWRLQAEALGKATDATDGTQTATDDLNTELTAQAQLAQDAQDSIDALADALDDLNGPTLDARQAERDWQESIAGVSEAIEQQIADLASQYESSGMSAGAARERAEAEVAVADKLDISTEAGRRNQSALDDMASSAAARADSTLALTGSLDGFTTSLEGSRQALHDAAVEMGLTEDEAWAYVESVLAIPDTATTQALLDTQKAEQDLARFKQTLAANNVVITADLRNSGGYYANRAAGSIDFFGNGALRLMDPLADLVQPGTFRVVGDRSDVPELYAPLDGSSRSRRLWDTAGQMMGWDASPAPVVVALPAPASAPTGPVELSESSVTRLAAAILAGAREQAGAVVGATARDAAGRRGAGGWS